eukprot:6330678-Amphidinium_carterae.1
MCATLAAAIPLIGRPASSRLKPQSNVDGCANKKTNCAHALLQLAVENDLSTARMLTLVASAQRRRVHVGNVCESVDVTDPVWWIVVAPVGGQYESVQLHKLSIQELSLVEQSWQPCFLEAID